MTERAEQLTDFAAILTGQKPDETAEMPDQVDAEQTVEEPSASEEIEAAPVEKPTKLSVKELAEKLEMEPAELYAALNIKVGDSEMSLSEFKDRASDLTKANELRELAESHKTESENEILRQRREIALAQQRYQPTDAERRDAELEFQRYVQSENAAALQVIPEWKEPAAQKAGLDAIADLLNHYAFSPAETQTMVDHRYLKLMHDFASIRARLQKAEKAVVKDKRKQSSRSQRKSPATGIDKAIQLHKAGKMSQESAVAAIIADGMKK